LYVAPKIPGDFKSFLSTEGGYGTVGVRDGNPYFDLKAGAIEVAQIKYRAKEENELTIKNNG
jgi:hypothetical protein